MLVYLREEIRVLFVLEILKRPPWLAKIYPRRYRESQNVLIVERSEDWGQSIYQEVASGVAIKSRGV